MNKLFYGDNLVVLRESIKDESVDLVYLDPPFNSKRDPSSPIWPLRHRRSTRRTKTEFSTVMHADER